MILSYCLRSREFRHSETTTMASSFFVLLACLLCVHARPNGFLVENLVADPTSCVKDSDCEHYGLCVNRQCLCDRPCPMIVLPICGSDGRTYQNECLMKVASCKEKKTIFVFGQGACESCEDDSDCSDYGLCNQQYHLCFCVRPCPAPNPDNSSTVCGSDGNTYGDLCDMQVEACMRHKMITVIHAGPCEYSSFLRLFFYLESCKDDSDCSDYGLCNQQYHLCMCARSCPQGYTVCGSDGSTYDNPCEMQVEACMRREMITVIHAGPCINCNKTSDCSDYGDCDLKTHRCWCIRPCPPANNSTRICGSDGKTYPNTCQMEITSCQQHRLVTVAHQGPCHINRQTTENLFEPVAEPTYCVIDSQCIDYGQCVQNFCVCERVCPEVYSPVCGNDGHTYSSQCDMEAASCSEHKLITVSHAGACSEPNMCVTDSDCVDYGHCVDSKCVCDRVCPEVYSPVCGSDGHTYSSLCDMEVASCSEHKLLTVSHAGACSEPNTCATESDCANYGDCVGGKCVCDRVCPEIYSPVCGSDGHTYSSLCDLQVESCEKHTMLSVAHQGRCDGEVVLAAVPSCLSDEDCVDYGHCVSSQCVCDKVCPEVVQPVCGSDGHTYSSRCDLEVASCKSHLMITVTHDGSCSGPSGCTTNSDCSDYGHCVDQQCVCDRVCPDVYNPVCGSDGHTYGSLCDLQVASCSEHKFIISTHMGPCVQPKACFKDSQCADYGHCENRLCVCDAFCPEEYKPVCGSDGHTYANACEMQVTSCHEQKMIISVRSGPCDPEL
ncbi:agrin-like [Corticium candelabrum]|uniref:agrin-like n=1 Tax=Corticium candelabrum TaxID=121492 RepID=UPI002E25ABF2|nr:agrin-like [Corticium candelabrum]